MKLDELMDGWRSQDASTFFGVDKTLLHQALRQEQATLEKERRRARRAGYVSGAILLSIAGLFFAILIDPNQPPSFAARLVVWDYVVGIGGVAAAVTIAVAVFALRRSHQARERGFGDSLRDHLRRRIAQIDDEATVERRLGFIVLVAVMIAATAITIASTRIAHVPAPYSELALPLAIWTVLIAVFLFREWFSQGPRRWREKNVPRKRQLEALLKELDGG